MNDRGRTDGLAGKVAIVTGAGRNIGRQVALTFAERGCDVAVNVGSRSTEAEAVAAEVRARGRRAIAVVADVGRTEGVDDLVRRTLAELGRVDIVASVAAIRPETPLTAITDAEWDRVLAVNLGAAFRLTRAVAPHMIARGSGSIIYFSGASAFHGGAHDAHVAASKAGLHGLTKALAMELGEFGIRVNALVIGTVDTVRAEPSKFPVRNAVRRRGTPSEIADICAYIASDQASYITGQLIGAHGGAPI